MFPIFTKDSPTLNVVMAVKNEWLEHEFGMELGEFYE